MNKKTLPFTSANVDCYFNADFTLLNKISAPGNNIILTDENVYAAHKRKFKEYKIIVVPAGEANKNQQTVDFTIKELIASGADRKTTLVGVGGGVVTDLTGYVAGIYMRGIKFGFVPTSILAMVDAAIGGKNGINVGLYKNMVGLISQPSFILYDHSFLKSLPNEEWINGFAEIIKHACIKDAGMFNFLEEKNLSFFKKDKDALVNLIRKNVMLKSKIVQKDEYESGERKILNFGHTLGHAIENLYQIPHGFAISIGMSVACNISAQLIGFSSTERVLNLLKKYSLPRALDFDKEAVFQMMEKDKKGENNTINYILLKKIGQHKIYPLSNNELKQLINQL